MNNYNSRFAAAGTQPNAYNLDNKCLNRLEAVFGNQRFFQQVPPACHHANSVERSI